MIRAGARLILTRGRPLRYGQVVPVFDNTPSRTVGRRVAEVRASPFNSSIAPTTAVTGASKRTPCSSPITVEDPNSSAWRVVQVCIRDRFDVARSGSESAA